MILGAYGRCPMLGTSPAPVLDHRARRQPTSGHGGGALIAAGTAGI
jgi:hypothetical protein